MPSSASGARPPQTRRTATREFVRHRVRGSRRRALATLPSLFTLGNMMCGFAAILVSIRGQYALAAVLLGLSILFDITDGAVARLVGSVTPFGLQFDSLADLVSFGLAPALLAFALFSDGRDSLDALGWIACFLWVACAAIRLARFNVSPKDGRFFCGVPTTMAAAVLAVTVAIGLPVPGAVQVAGVALLAFAMVSSFPYAKLARLVKLPPWLWLAPVVGALVDIRLTFALIVMGYLFSGPVLWLRQRRTA